jgi:hypothetical protein
MLVDSATTRSYSVLGHSIAVCGDGEGADWWAYLDTLLAPSQSSVVSACLASIITVRRNEGAWVVADALHTTEQTCRDAPTVAQVIEWRAYTLAVYHLDGSLAVHAGALVHRGRTVLLPGASGAGKTTLTLALSTRGWLPLTDDVCPLVESEGEWVAMKCLRCCHVDSRSHAVLLAAGVSLEGPIASLTGFYRPKRWGEPAPVRAIIIPRYAANAPTSFAPITQAECLGQLASMMFEQRALPAHERRRTAARLAAWVPAYSLTYSSLGEALDVFDKLEAQLDAAKVAGERRPAPIYYITAHDGDIRMVETTHPRRRDDIETHIMPDGTCLLFDAASNEGRALNAAGALIWDYCDGALSAGEIAGELAALLPGEEHIHAETLALLEELDQLGYLMPTTDAPDLAVVPPPSESNTTE